MVRASRFPFKNFEYNIRRARALARLDGYLEDILYGQGKRTIGVFLDMVKEVTQLVGINTAAKKFEEIMKTQLQLEYERKGKEYYEKIGKEMMKRLKPRVKKIAEMFKDLELVMDQTLPEQALIMAVTAFEVYLKEITVSIVTLNPSIKKRFHKEIEDSISLSRLEGYKEDAKRAQGEIVAEQIKLDTRRIKSLMKRLTNIENIFNDKQTEQKIHKIFECRHIIIHRAGLIDPKFKKTTKFRGAIDTQVKITRRYAIETINILEKLVRRIETNIS